MPEQDEGSHGSAWDAAGIAAFASVGPFDSDSVSVTSRGSADRNDRASSRVVGDASESMAVPRRPARRRSLALQAALAECRVAFADDVVVEPTEPAQAVGLQLARQARQGRPSQSHSEQLDHNAQMAVAIKKNPKSYQPVLTFCH